MDPEVSDGWSKLVECELKVPAKLVVNELNLREERVDGLSHKIVGKNDVEKMEEELVRNELMGSTGKGRFESRIAAPWCGSRVAGWRVAAGKTTVSDRLILILARFGSVFGFAG